MPSPAVGLVATASRDLHAGCGVRCGGEPALLRSLTCSSLCWYRRGGGCGVLTVGRSTGVHGRSRLAFSAWPARRGGAAGDVGQGGGHGAGPVQGQDPTHSRRPARGASSVVTPSTSSSSGSECFRCSLLRWRSGSKGSAAPVGLVPVWVRGRLALAALPHGLQGGSHEVGPGPRTNLARDGWTIADRGRKE